MLILYIIAIILSLAVVGVILYFVIRPKSSSGGNNNNNSCKNCKDTCYNGKCVTPGWVCQAQPGPWYNCSDALSWPTGCSPSKNNTVTRSVQCQDDNGNVLPNTVCETLSPAPITSTSDGCGWDDSSCEEGVVCACDLYHKNPSGWHTQQDCLTTCNCG